MEQSGLGYCHRRAVDGPPAGSILITMASPTPLTGRFRGGSVGAVCAMAALPAHSFAGAALPSTGTLLVLAGFGATVGVLVAQAPTGLPRLMASLWMGQLVGHLLLAVMTGHGALPSPLMLASHTATAVIVGCALCFGERLILLLTSSVRHWLQLITRVTDTPLSATVRATRTAITWHQRLPCVAVSPRGPPTTAVAP